MKNIVRDYFNKPFPILLAMSIASMGCLPSMSERLRELREPAESERRDLEKLIDETLAINRDQRLLKADRNAAWQVFHGAVAYGIDLPLAVKDETSSAIKYLFEGGSLPGWNPALGPEIRPGFPGIKIPVQAGSFVGQGHVDQFLAYLSQSGVPLDTPIRLDGKELTLENVARQAQRDISQNPFQEYSWTLIALTNYFPDEKEWVAEDGKQWTLDLIVGYEAQENLVGSACGGMHRLMGLAHAVKYRERLKQPITDGWLLAKNVVDESIAKARAFQNSDGSFSTRYTERPGNSADLTSSLAATGHTLEFLAYALPASQLQEAWVERAVVKLCEMLHSSREIDLECGSIYHALGGLRLYRKRRFGADWK
jgi:hypothetical protein